MFWERRRKILISCLNHNSLSIFDEENGDGASFRNASLIEHVKGIIQLHLGGFCIRNDSVHNFIRIKLGKWGGDAD